jgi:hypothetical protein
VSHPLPIRRWLFSLLAVLLLAPPAPAQVTFINVDDIPSATSFTNRALTTVTSAPPVHLHCAVVRYLPAKGGKIAPEFTGESTLAAVVASLAKQGQVNLLYSGDRVTPGGIANPATFDSVERRPAFSTAAEQNQTLTNREFGLRLSLKTRPLADGRTELDWQGRFLWSSDLLNAWAGEKYLVFGMKVAQFARPGLFYYQSDDPDEDEPAGLNLRALFGKKKKAEPPPKSVVPDISFLTLENQEIPLSGQRPVKPGELIVISTPTNRDPKQAEFIYLMVRFTEAE